MSIYNHLQIINMNAFCSDTEREKQNKHVFSLFFPVKSFLLAFSCVDYINDSV